MGASAEGAPVYARVAGHRVALVPRAPFVVRRTEEGVRVEHASLAANVRVVGDSLRYVLFGAKALRDLAHPVETDYAGEFRLETSRFHCGWPERFSLASADREGPFLFDVVPDDDPAGGAWLFVAGPYTRALCPDLDALVGEGQEIVTRDAETLEVAYAHDGEAHRKRHARFESGDEVFVITAQGRADDFEPAREALRVMAESLTFF